MTEAKIIPFRGRKPSPTPPPDAINHPLPWHTEKGFVWDANDRLVGSTLVAEAADWVVRVVNSQLEAGPEPERD
jgi:hypothetical protein